MKKTILLVALAVFAIGAISLYAEESKDKEKDTTTTEAPKKIKHQTQCPVMTGPINKSLYVDHSGKRIYVCCAGCINMVKKDPQKYINKLEKDGITLDKTPKSEKEKPEKE